MLIEKYSVLTSSDFLSAIEFCNKGVGISRSELVVESGAKELEKSGWWSGFERKLIFIEEHMPRKNYLLKVTSKHL